MKLRHLIAGLAIAIGLGSTAHAATPGYATGNVNMRLGPSTSYAVIDTVPRGGRLTIFGCLQGYAWCDVVYAGRRGWVSSRYLTSGERHVYRGGPGLGIPFIGFDLYSYHRDHYFDRPWYRDRYYNDYWGDRRHDWRDDLRHWRDDRRHWREDRRDWREGRRHDRRDWREGRREDRREDRLPVPLEQHEAPSSGNQDRWDPNSYQPDRSGGRG